MSLFPHLCLAPYFGQVVGQWPSCLFHLDRVKSIQAPWWCSGLWIEVVLLVCLTAALYLEGWIGITGPHPSLKSLTCWLQGQRPTAALQQACSTTWGVMLTRHHWANDLHDAGYWPRCMKFPQALNGYVFRTKASHLDGGHRLWPGMERDGLRHATLPKTHHMYMTTITQSLPARSSPGTRTALSVSGHQDGGEKYATDGPKSLRARNNITKGTWNVRSLVHWQQQEKLKN